MLLQIVYMSKSATPMSETEVLDLARYCSVNNKAKQVTGVLYHDSGHFIQCIEGEEKTLIRLYAQILEDPRHLDVVTAVIKPIEKRMFPSWAMGVVAKPDPDIDLSQVLPLAEAKQGAWNQAAWERILESFRLAVMLDPYPQD